MGNKGMWNTTWKSVFCLGLGISLTMSVTAFAEPLSSQEAQEKVDSLQQEKDSAQSEIDSLQSQLVDLLGKIDQLELDMDSKQSEIDQAQEELEEAEKKQEEQYEMMKLRIQYMYEEGSGIAQLERVLDSGSIAEICSQVEYASSVQTYDRDAMNEYIAITEEVKSLKTSLEAQMNEMVELQASYQEESDALNEVINSKSEEIADFEEQLLTAALEVQEAKDREAAASVAATASQASSSSSSSSSTAVVYNAPDNSVGSTVVAAAYSQLGVPYVWGGTTPYVGLDCSGLTSYCYKQAGISIPRTSSAQLAAGTKVADPQPGDICWTSGHVAIYIGNGQMIEAPQSGDVVKISSVRATYYLRFY